MNPLNRFAVRKIVLMLTDVSIIVFSCFFITCLLTGFNHVNPQYLYIRGLLIFCLTLSRVLFKTYGSIWRFADTREYLYLICADLTGFVLWLAIAFLGFRHEIHMIYFFSAFILSLILVLCSRILYRQLHQFVRTRKLKGNKKTKVAIVGAGHAGIMLLEELGVSEDSPYEPHCFFDRDRAKVGSVIHGVRVYSIAKMSALLGKLPIDEVIIAIPTLPVEQKQIIMDACIEAGCRVKVYAFPFDRAQEKEHPSPSESIRNIHIEDLLCRETVTFSSGPVKALVTGKVVLVTGGGGSIGSELCRQVAAMSPKLLILLDIYENNAYTLQRELQQKYGDEFPLSVEIASVRDTAKLDRLFARYSPDIVFHAAAHKHVPLMEDNADEAIKNNVFGTFNVVNASEKYHVKKFILISTDKAVNPTNVMGATKRVCEMIIQSKRHSATDFVAVRFGNVLGSNGSVLHVFTQQIYDGGPVTVTDKRITRYFMTISEAVQLVLQAGTMAAKSEIFVLDMGQPIKIIDLAENMIKLAGLVPYKDIQITEMGLRPGEKLYEEILTNTENLESTDNKKIFIERGDHIEESDLLRHLSILKNTINDSQPQEIREAIQRVVPTYHPAETKSGQENTQKAHAAPGKEAVTWQWIPQEE